MSSTAKAPRSQTEADAPMMRAFLAHTKCPPSSVERFTPPATSGPAGFFEFAGLRLYGRVSAGSVSPTWSENLPAIDSEVSVTSTSVTLPFNPTEIIDGLRLEKYVTGVNSQISYISSGTSGSRRLYYALRPLLPCAGSCSGSSCRTGQPYRSRPGQWILPSRISSTGYGSSH